MENKKGNLFSSEVMAGAISGGLARFCVAPMDVLKIRLQVQSYAKQPKYCSIAQSIKTIFAEEGLRGFWKGTVPGMALYSVYAGIQFWVYGECKKQFGSFTSGAIASAVGMTITFPLDVLRTRMTIEKGTGFRVLLGGIRGLFSGGLYSGLGTTLIQVVPGMAITFSVHEQTKRYLGDWWAGALAGVANKTLTMPLDVLRRRYQARNVVNSVIATQVRPNHSPLKELIIIARTEGVRALFAGWTVAVLKAAPTTAIIFACHKFLTH